MISRSLPALIKTADPRSYGAVQCPRSQNPLLKTPRHGRGKSWGPDIAEHECSAGESAIAKNEEFRPALQVVDFRNFLTGPKTSDENWT
jgi:hypothetical protein